MKRILFFIAAVCCAVLQANALPDGCSKTVSASKLSKVLSDFAKVGSYDSLVKDYKLDNYYVLCIEPISEPATIVNNRSLSLVVRNVSIASTKATSAAVTIGTGTSNVLLDNVSITAPNALKISGAGHKLFNVTLTGTRAAASVGLELANAQNLTASNLIITEFANGIVADTLSTATLTAPRLTWAYQSGAAQMQGDIGILLGDDGTTGFGTAAGAMQAMLGGEAPADAPGAHAAALITLDQPVVKGFTNGIKVFAGKQLEVKGGIVSGYPYAPENNFNLISITTQWPGETGILLNGDDHALRASESTDDHGQPVTVGTNILGFREQLQLEGTRITLDNPVLEISDLSAARVNRCWTRASGAQDCGAKGIDGVVTGAVNDIASVQYGLKTLSEKTSYNFVYYNETDAPTALQEPVVLGKLCNVRRTVEVNGQAVEVCDLTTDTNTIDRVVGVLPARVCDGDAGTFHLMSTVDFGNKQARINTATCAVAKQFTDSAEAPAFPMYVPTGDSTFALHEFDNSTCHVTCELTGDASATGDPIRTNQLLSLIQTLPTGHVQWPASSGVDVLGSYTPVQVSIIPDVKPTTPGFQTPIIESSGIGGNAGGSVVGGLGATGTGAPALDLPDNHSGSSNSDEPSDIGSGSNFSGDFGGSGVISTENGAGNGGSGAGSLLSGGATLGMKSGCSLIIE